MKKLLFKELRLCLNPQVIVFVCLSVLIVIPGWPSLTSFIYTFMAIVVIFPIALANKDLEFTALLPVRKTDLVKGKVMLAVSIELASILISLPFALLKVFVLNNIEGFEVNVPDLGINLILYGIVLFLCGFFNLIFIPWYYKNPFKIAKVQIVSTFIVIALTSVLIVLFIPIPDMSIFVNTFTGTALIVQFASLLAGILVFLSFTYLSFRLGAKNIASVDL